jgi:hypothetical protein
MELQPAWLDEQVEDYRVDFDSVCILELALETPQPTSAAVPDRPFPASAARNPPSVSCFTYRKPHASLAKLGNPGKRQEPASSLRAVLDNWISLAFGLLGRTNGSHIPAVDVGSQRF